MANYNTIASMPLTVASGNVLAETAFGLAPGNTTRGTLVLPGSLTASNSALDGRETVLRCGILVTTGTSSTYGPSIRLNSTSNTNLTTFTNDTAIITPAAPTLATVTRMMTINARLTWDVTTARLQGSFSFHVDTTYTAYATLTASLSAGVAAASNIQWLVTGIFGSTNAGNTAVLKFFEWDIQ